MGEHISPRIFGFKCSHELGWVITHFIVSAPLPNKQNKMRPAHCQFTSCQFPVRPYVLCDEHVMQSPLPSLHYALIYYFAVINVLFCSTELHITTMHGACRARIKVLTMNMTRLHMPSKEKTYRHVCFILLYHPF